MSSALWYYSMQQAYSYYFRPNQNLSSLVLSWPAHVVHDPCAECPDEARVQEARWRDLPHLGGRGWRAPPDRVEG